jgi:hypothetical protein
MLPIKEPNNKEYLSSLFIVFLYTLKKLRLKKYPIKIENETILRIKFIPFLGIKNMNLY